MKVFGQLEVAQLECLVGNPSNAPIGRIFADITNPVAANPKMWTGASWISLNPINFTTPFTTKGDLLTYDGSNNQRFGVGADGQVLTANSTQPFGLQWTTPSGGGSGTLTIATKSGNYTVLTTDDVIELNSSGGPFNITMPSASVAAKKPYRFKMLPGSTHPVTFLPNLTDTFDGNPTVVLSAFPQAMELIVNTATTGWSIY